MSQIRRRRFLAVAGALLALPLANAQQNTRIHRIGCLAPRSRSTPANPEVFYDAFTQGMRELGYVEGKNIVSEWRFADSKYERLPALAAELVQLKPELIVTHSTPATEALQKATSTIPIVFGSATDPVASGFAASLARPGRNITGLSLINIDVSPKYIELLKLMVPSLSSAAVLVNPGSSYHPDILKGLQAAARQLGVKILPVNAHTPEEIERGFAAMSREHADAAIILSDAFFFGQRRRITELAARNRLPAMYSFREYVEVGGLISYGQNIAEYYRHAATYVDKILKGARPGDLPIEQPTKIHLAINGGTAKTLGITIPQELLYRTDEVIR